MDDETPQPKMLRVVAPATLPQGYTFDVLLDHNRPFTVTVPTGGIREGDSFTIPLEETDGPTNTDMVNRSYDNHKDYRNEDEEEDEDQQTLPIQPSSSLSSNEANRINHRSSYNTRESKDTHEDQDLDSETQDSQKRVVLGHWRHSVCACCDVVTQSTFWMGFVCTPILVAQLLTRLALDWRGRRTDLTTVEGREEASLTYNRIVLGAIAVLLFGYIPVVGVVIMGIYWFVVVVLIGKNLRRETRSRYKIPAHTCNAVDDCLCMCVCGCCSAIQIARHTHNDKEYPGYCCTTTGLEPDAPSVTNVV